MGQSGAVIRRKIEAATGRRPDDAVMAFAEQLCPKISEALLLEPKFSLQPVLHDAEITHYKAFISSQPPKSLFCYDDGFLIHLDNKLTYYWIEVGLSGEAGDTAPPESYTPTLADSAMSRPFFECLYTAIVRELPNGPKPDEDPSFEGMSIERNVDNVLFLEDSTKILVMTFAFGERPDQGYRARVVLPINTVEEILLVAAPKAIDDAPTSGVWANHMQEETLATPLKLRAVIDRTPTPLNDISQFAPGHVILIPREQLEVAQLIADTPGKSLTLGTGRLGQYQSNKAVKLNSAPDAATRALLIRTLL